MGDVLDRWRLNQGFNPYDDATQDLAIQSWVHILDREQVPAECYNELFERSLKTRAIAIHSGRDLPRMGAELLLAHWLGENGLMKQKRTEATENARLPEHRVKVCPDCLDTGVVVMGGNKGQLCLHRS